METKSWRSADDTSIFIQTEIRVNEYKEFSVKIFDRVLDIIVEKAAREYLNVYQDEIFKKLSIKKIRNMTYKLIAKEIEKRLLGKKEEK